jgi:plastocyanin
MSTWLTRTILILALLIAAAGTAQAGGWATVRLDNEPGPVVEGEAWRFGFVVKQHDKTPTNDVRPVVAAVHSGTGDTVTVVAVQEGPVGHFVAELSLPASGDWKWSIKPEPFEATSFETLAVVPSREVAESTTTEPALSLVAPLPGGGWRISLTVDIAPLPVAASQAEPVEVTITDTGFSPAYVEIPVGTEVNWTNRSATPHGLMSEDLAFRDSSLLDNGGGFRQVFSQPGTYRYWCGPHPYMSGTIVVTGADVALGE